MPVLLLKVAVAIASSKVRTMVSPAAWSEVPATVYVGGVLSAVKVVAAIQVPSVTLVRSRALPTKSCMLLAATISKYEVPVDTPNPVSACIASLSAVLKVTSRVSPSDQAEVLVVRVLISSATSVSLFSWRVIFVSSTSWEVSINSLKFMVIVPASMSNAQLSTTVGAVASLVTALETILAPISGLPARSVTPLKTTVTVSPSWM